MQVTQEFYGANAGYAAELYERYRQDPASVDAETRAYFDRGYVPAGDTPSPVPAGSLDIAKIVAAARLARVIREIGHLDAHIDPLGSKPIGDPSLAIEAHGLTFADLEALPATVVGGPLAKDAPNANAALERLRKVYSGSVGYEDDHIQVAAERDWLRNAVETGRFFNDFDADEKRDVLERLTEVDTFEQFLQKTPPFQGQKRFSIEGVDIMVPMLDAIIRCTARAGTREVVMGMAHRGRLNVLAHVLNKPYEAILAEFPNPNRPVQQMSVSGSSALGYMGDVKYHKGYRREYKGDAASRMPITLAPNPSHLEFVNPAVVGRARAAQETRTHPGAPVQDIRASLAIVIHGDAAFPGQGVVAETLNLSQLKGYHYRQQPDRLHDDARRQSLDPLCQRPGEGLRDSDRPCKRRRRPGVHRRFEDGLRLSREVWQGFPDRPHRLPPHGP
jgi:2-oxoglutarate dehydrogenase E1 component